MADKIRGLMQISVIAHNIRSTHNVGSLFRTCDGFGVYHLYLSGYTPYPELPHDNRLPHISRKIHQQIRKTALGAEATVPFSYHENAEDLITKLEPDHTLIALEQAPSSISLPRFQTDHIEKLVLLLGEEVSGVSVSLLGKCHHTIEIPMYGQKESFNVSVAAAIALYSLKERPTMLQS